MYLRDYTLNDTGHMQTDLSHLPEAKQRELAELVHLIRDRGPVEMVILYGSYARGDYKEEKDLKPGRWSGHASDYDLLLVVEHPAAMAFEERWRSLQMECKHAGFSAPVRIIVHTIDELDEALSEGRYFFLDIKREGRMLYDSERLDLVEPRLLSPSERQRIARDDFEYWFNRATGFYRTYELTYGVGDLRIAIFSLNQATESAYKAVLLTFTRYIPHEHLLEILSSEAERHAPLLAEVFPRQTRDQQERFQQLDRAYIGARYHKGFQVFWQDVEYLAPQVMRLLALVEPLCRERIAALGQAEEAPSHD